MAGCGDGALHWGRQLIQLLRDSELSVVGQLLSCTNGTWSRALRNTTTIG